MKNVIKLLAIILSVVIIFSGCSLSNGTIASNKKDITLTTENVYDYLTFSLHGGGGDSDYSSYYGIYYKSLVANGNISGVSGYEYDNVSVNLVFEYKITKKGEDFSQSFTTLPKTVELNIGGSGVVSVSDPFSVGLTEVKCLGYEVVSVTGTVKPM